VILPGISRLKVCAYSLNHTEYCSDIYIDCPHGIRKILVKTFEPETIKSEVSHSKVICMARGLPSVTTAEGDSGTATLGCGGRVPKDSPVFEFLGNADELSAALGVCALYVPQDTVTKLQTIQSLLCEMMGVVACGMRPSDRLATFTQTLEEWGIDLDKVVPPLTAFILPGGHPSAAFLHLARTICRRVERTAVAAVLKTEHGPLCCKILNRLSDYLFLLARYQNVVNKVEDIPAL
jgi:cob(I)alamin adenosyltransferase